MEWFNIRMCAVVIFCRMDPTVSLVTRAYCRSFSLDVVNLFDCTALRFGHCLTLTHKFETKAQNLKSTEPSLILRPSKPNLPFSEIWLNQTLIPNLLSLPKWNFINLKTHPE